MDFALVGPFRSGTSFVLDSFRRQKELLIHGEVFHSSEIDTHIDPRIMPMLDLDQRSADPVGFLKRIYSLKSGHAGVGLKVLFGHSDEALDWLLEESDIAKIFVYRPNILAQLVSIRLAQGTGVWNDVQEYRLVSDFKIDFNPDEFVAYATWMQEKVDGTLAVLAKGQPFKVIRYHPNTLAQQTAEAIDWLGLRSDGLGQSCLSSIRKLHKGNLLQRFSNPDTVMQTLKTMDRIHWVEE